MRLCGISSRFQLLSPCTRQVTHALLTRPPLSHKIISPEGNQIKCFVRLACVKHAASVHPEPGSNSLVKLFDRRSKLTLANFFRRSLFQLHFYCFWLFVLNVSIHECFHPLCEFFTSRKCFQSCDFHTFTIFSQRFSRLYYCSVIKVLFEEGPILKAFRSVVMY